MPLSDSKRPGKSRTFTFGFIAENLFFRTHQRGKTPNPRYYHSFHWQSGYGMFSVSYKSKEAVYQYIANQQAHHKKVSIEKEWRSLLKSANVTDYQPDLYWVKE